jgi:hypothetical protein
MRANVAMREQRWSVASKSGIGKACGDERSDFGEGEGGVVVARDEHDVVAVSKDAREGIDEEGVVVEDGGHGGHGVFGRTWQVVKFADTFDDAWSIEIEHVTAKHEGQTIAAHTCAQVIEHVADISVGEAMALAIPHPLGGSGLDFAEMNVGDDDRVSHHIDACTGPLGEVVGGFTKKGYRKMDTRVGRCRNDHAHPKGAMDSSSTGANTTNICFLAKRCVKSTGR